MTMREYKEAQKERTLVHAKLSQSTDSSEDDGDASFSFVVCADTQIGMSSDNKEWETELAYSRIAIKLINELEPRPRFCCVCGDLTDMEQTFWKNQGDVFSKNQCDEIQKQQRKDFQETWSALHEDIALVCVCGNHDVGNIPTKDSIDEFKNSFGDDYLAFWGSKYSYNIVVNTTLFSNPSGAPDMHTAQLQWLEDRLKYAQSKNATSIFIFGHHPWFLYSEDEDAASMPGISPYKHWRFPDGYFHIPTEYRMPVMKLCQKYNVTSAFSGHFHQNHLAEASFGMKMIITSSLSEVFESTGKSKNTAEPTARGMRIVHVHKDGSFGHKFVRLPECRMMR